MELNIPIKKGSKTSAVIKLLNPFLSNLCTNEIKIVSCIIDLGIESVKGSNRVLVREKVNMGKYNFNNYILSLKKKGVLLQTIDDLIMNPKIVTLTEQVNYTITFVEN